MEKTEYERGHNDGYWKAVMDHSSEFMVESRVKELLSMKMDDMTKAMQSVAEKKGQALAIDIAAVQRVGKILSSNNGDKK
jgi:hypothetical protein